MAVEMDLTPSQIMHFLQLGLPELEERVLGSISIWYCLTCETCYARCPQEVDIPVIMDFLRAESLRCLGCGVCAYVCPTCTCFDLQDEMHGETGVRYRCWDTCEFGLFTQHTSGHNPRPVNHQRWRQRIMHKFSYEPDRLKVLGCVGCGRCSRACPADMNIVDHLREILETA